MELRQFGFDESKHGIHINNVLTGRVVGKTSSGLRVVTNETTVEVTGKASLGDFILINQASHQVEKILTTQTKLKLPSGKLLTNFSTAFLLTEVGDNFNPDQLGLRLNAVWDSGALPVIVLVNPDGLDLKEVLYEVRQIAGFVDVYDSDDRVQLNQLRRHLKKGETTLLLGGTEKAKDVFFAKLFNASLPCKNETLIVYDEMIFMIVNDEGDQQEDAVDNPFAQIDALILNCRFNDCTHSNEPGCRVREALRKGVLTQPLYEAYLELHLDEEEAVVEYLDEEDDNYFRLIDKEREKHKVTKKSSKAKEESSVY